MRLLTQLAMDRLKPSILLHGDTLCETEVTAAIQILKMLELENRVREDELRDDGGQSLMGNDVGEWNDDHPRLPVRIRRRLDMLQRAATDSERQYVMRVLEAECPSPSMLTKYKRAYKWVVAFCTWKYKTTPSSTTGKCIRFGDIYTLVHIAQVVDCMLRRHHSVPCHRHENCAVLADGANRSARRSAVARKPAYTVDGIFIHCARNGFRYAGGGVYFSR